MSLRFNTGVALHSLSHILVFSFYCAAWNADVVYRWEFCLSVRLWNAWTVTKWKTTWKII